MKIWLKKLGSQITAKAPSSAKFAKMKHSECNQLQNSLVLALGALGATWCLGGKS